MLPHLLWSGTTRKLAGKPASSVPCFRDRHIPSYLPVPGLCILSRLRINQKNSRIQWIATHFSVTRKVTM